MCHYNSHEHSKSTAFAYWSVCEASLNPSLTEFNQPYQLILSEPKTLTSQMVPKRSLFHFQETVLVLYACLHYVVEIFYCLT